MMKKLGFLYFSVSSFCSGGQWVKIFLPRGADFCNLRGVVGGRIIEVPLFLGECVRAQISSTSCSLAEHSRAFFFRNLDGLLNCLGDLWHAQFVRGLPGIQRHVRADHDQPLVAAREDSSQWTPRSAPIGKEPARSQTEMIRDAVLLIRPFCRSHVYSL